MTEYERIKKAMNIQVGDLVKITHKTPSGYLGWDDLWTTAMNSFIGTTARVKRIFSKGGFVLDGCDGWCFPATSLEIRSALRDPIDLSNNCYAEFLLDDGIRIGGVVISFDILQQIYHTAKKIREES